MNSRIIVRVFSDSEQLLRAYANSAVTCAQMQLFVSIWERKTVQIIVMHRATKLTIYGKMCLLLT